MSEEACCRNPHVRHPATVCFQRTLRAVSDSSGALRSLASRHRDRRAVVASRVTTYNQRAHGNLLESGGILTLASSLSYDLFSDMHENRMSIGDFYVSRMLQLFQLFRINSTNFGPKQTPKTPRAASTARISALNCFTPVRP